MGEAGVVHGTGMGTGAGMGTHHTTGMGQPTMGEHFLAVYVSVLMAKHVLTCPAHPHI
jgi:hypothetical protein